MSAYVVSDNHINALVNYAIDKKASYFFANCRRGFDDPQKIADVLLAENYRSVNYRYNETDSHTMTFKRNIMSTFKAVDILKAIDGLDYQSCETDDWDKSEAFAILEGIKAAAIRALPGYDSSSGWSIR